MLAADASHEPLKSLPCAAGHCAGPVAPGQVECGSHRLKRPEGRKGRIAELRGEVTPVPPTMPVRVAAVPAVVAPQPGPLPESTLPLARSLWELAVRDGVQDLNAAVTPIARGVAARSFLPRRISCSDALGQGSPLSAARYSGSCIDGLLISE